MEKNTNKSFNYTYSAVEQEEIKKIRNKYITPEEDKVQKLRNLDSAVYSKATVFSLSVGIIGTLIFGVGMCCCLVWKNLFVLGIAVGVPGIVLVSLAYPVYNRALKKERAKIAPEIIRLTDELIK